MIEAVKGYPETYVLAECGRCGCPGAYRLAMRAEMNLAPTKPIDVLVYLFKCPCGSTATLSCTVPAGDPPELTTHQHQAATS